MRFSGVFVRKTLKDKSGKWSEGSYHAIFSLNPVVMLFNSPIEVE